MADDETVPRLVVLDTTTLVADRTLAGADAQALLLECRAGRRRVLVPEVVLIEAVARYRRDVTTAADAVAAALRKFSRLTRVSEVPPGPMMSPQAEADAYEADLRTRFADYGVTVAPTPSVDHLELVKMAVDRRRPFQESGTGYRDALIWATVRELAHGEHLAFVTNNSRDFASGQGEAATTLHADLAGDLPSKDAVRLWANIADLVDAMGSPDPGLLESLESDFGERGPLWLDLAARFSTEAGGLDFAGGVQVDPDYPVVEAVVLGVFDVHRIELTSVKSVGPQTSVVIDAVVHADVEMQVTVLEQHPELRVGGQPATVAVPIRCFGALWFEVSAVLEQQDGLVFSHASVNTQHVGGAIDLGDYTPPTVAFA